MEATSFFWKGKPAQGRCIHSTSASVESQLISDRMELPAGINEHRLTLHLKLSNSQSSVHMPQRLTLMMVAKNSLLQP